MEINQGYAIRRVIAFDNECGFVLGENPKASDPYVTWQFNMRDGERNYFWGHYCDDARLAESDLKNRAEDYQRRYYVERIEQPPEQETYKYYSTQLLLCHAFLLAGFLDCKPHRTKIKFTFTFFVPHVITTQCNFTFRVTVFERCCISFGLIFNFVYMVEPMLPPDRPGAGR